MSREDAGPIESIRQPHITARQRTCIGTIRQHQPEGSIGVASMHADGKPGIRGERFPGILSANCRPASNSLIVDLLDHEQNRRLQQTIPAV